MIRLTTAASTNAPTPNLPTTFLSDLHLPTWRPDAGVRQLRAITEAQLTKHKLLPQRGILSADNGSHIYVICNYTYTILKEMGSSSARLPDWCCNGLF